MTDQMTPAEMRARVKSALAEVHYQDPRRTYSVAEVKRIVYSLVDANDRLADVIEWATHYTPARGYTLYEDQREELLRIARGETNEEARNHE